MYPFAPNGKRIVAALSRLEATAEIVAASPTENGIEFEYDEDGTSLDWETREPETTIEGEGIYLDTVGNLWPESAVVLEMGEDEAPYQCDKAGDPSQEPLLGLVPQLHKASIGELVAELARRRPDLDLRAILQEGGPDLSDIPELSPAFFESARLVEPADHPNARREDDCDPDRPDPDDSPDPPSSNPGGPAPGC